MNQEIKKEIPILQELYPYVNIEIDQSNLIIDGQSVLTENLTLLELEGRIATSNFGKLSWSEIETKILGVLKPPSGPDYHHNLTDKIAFYPIFNTRTHFIFFNAAKMEDLNVSGEDLEELAKANFKKLDLRTHCDSLSEVEIKYSGEYSSLSMFHNEFDYVWSKLSTNGEVYCKINNSSIVFYKPSFFKTQIVDSKNCYLGITKDGIFDIL